MTGFPYLRVDRFLASYRGELPDERLRAWTDALLRLDREARTVELANLAPGARAALHAALRETGLPESGAAVDVEGCGAALRDRDLAAPERRARLREAAAVPDEYSAPQRVAGLYVLTRIPFAYGVRRYEAGVQSVFDTPLDALAVSGRIVRHAPRRSGEDIDHAAVVSRIVHAAAGFRPPDPADVASLLAANAPVFEVDESLPEDRIGAVRLDDSGAPVVAGGPVEVYGRVAFTRLEGRVLAQAVYTAWFPGRPRTGPFDLLGGDFDALVWRVTLDERGAPLVFDTMHACGCYHMFFPTPRVAARPRPATLDEWAFMPQALPALPPGAPVRLRIASRTHYLVRVLDAPVQDDGHAYALRPESALRSLPGAAGTHRSLYRPDGIVAGSERGERWLFWPMGIREPGAMRQWGRHATAFVGRRHFDDADLIARYFTLRPAPEQGVELRGMRPPPPHE